MHTYPLDGPKRDSVRAASFQVTVLNLALLLFALTPFVGVLDKFAVFPVYLVTGFLCARFVKRLPLLLLIKGVIVIVLIFVHQNSIPTAVNLVSLLVADVYALSLGSLFARLSMEKFTNILFRTAVWTILAGTLVSVLLSQTGLDVGNPIEGLLEERRFRILAITAAGHSVAIELASLALICLLSGFIRVKGRLIYGFVLSVILIIAGSLTSILCLVVILGVSAFEWPSKGVLARTFVHLSLICLVAWVVSDGESFNILLKWFRVSVVGQDEAMYHGGDFTAGRKMLTIMMLELANGAPWVGVGHEHHWLQYGVMALTGEKGAMSETPLRLAAKYGWAFFVIVLATTFIPLWHGMLSKGRERVFFIAFGYCVLIISLSGTGFAQAQTTFYMVYGPIIFLAWARGRAKFLFSRMKETQ